MSDDRQLLNEYAQSGSRPAIETLIQRHLGLVYSSALRQVRDPHLAEDVTQAVFLVLTQKARTIRDGVATGGWLLAVTRCVVVNVMRKQATRKKHEHRAARAESLEAAAAEWEEIAPLLDEELNRLARADRDAIVLRFFQDKSFSEIGAELGFSEDAARMRVGRALERLRTRLGGRKLLVSTSAIAITMGMFAVGAVPKHVMAGTLAASVGGATPHSISLAKGAIKMFAWTKAKLISAVAAWILAGGTSVVVLTAPLAPQVGHAAEIAAPAAAPVQGSQPAVAAPAAAPAPAGPHGQRGNDGYI